MLTRNKLIRIVHTTIFKDVSNGGGVNPYGIVDNHLNKVLTHNLQDNSSPEVDSESVPVATATDSRGDMTANDESIQRSVSVLDASSKQLTVIDSRGDKSVSKSEVEDINFTKTNEDRTAR